MQDHPRLRGEHSFLSKENTEILGSPPPTRGTPDVPDAPDVPDGITPAYAGNTSNPAADIACSRDHPRLRGEHGKQI